MKMRLQKFMSQEGICSRRKAERYILDGLVKVNGETVTELGTQIDPEKDHVQYDPKIHNEEAQSITIAVYKPRGIVTNCPQKGESELKDILPDDLAMLSAIGRLDKASEGLILMTNNGQLAKRCLDPKLPHLRIYNVWLDKELNQAQIDKLESGLPMFGTTTKELTVEKVSELLYRFHMYEGKNRQIRRMIQKIGAHVTRLKRIQFGPIELSGLKPSQFLKLRDTEVQKLLNT